MNEKRKILLVEDNPNDSELISKEISANSSRFEILSASDGNEALKAIHETIKKGEALPNLILLDLRLPKLDGIEFVQILKKDFRLRKIPVVMLSSHSNPDEIDQAYRKNISCFVKKPVEYSEFKNVIAAIVNFWGEVVRLPEIEC